VRRLEYSASGSAFDDTAATTILSDNRQADMKLALRGLEVKTTDPGQCGESVVAAGPVRAHGLGRRCGRRRVGRR
jgi:hypothetical protein